jgi:hypothetical protein
MKDIDGEKDPPVIERGVLLPLRIFRIRKKRRIILWNNPNNLPCNFDAENVARNLSRRMPCATTKKCTKTSNRAKDPNKDRKPSKAKCHANASLIARASFVVLGLCIYKLLF